MSSPEKKPRSKNWLLVKFREYHTWLGLGAALFIVSTALTGIVLNHKDLIFGKEKDHPEEHAERHTALLTPSTDLGALPVSFARALAQAAPLLGADTSLEHLQLKNEHGTLVYKIKAMHREREEEREVWVDARSGEATLKEGYTMTRRAGDAGEKKSPDWKKIIDDIHTGKIAGTPGKLVIDATAIILAALTLSGVYLWWIPKLRKKESQRKAAEKGRAQE